MLYIDIVPEKINAEATKVCNNGSVIINKGGDSDSHGHPPDSEERGCGGTSRNTPGTLFTAFAISLLCSVGSKVGL